MKCPTCKETSLVMSEKKGIEIDYCPDCRGIWLDRGELDKILERSLAEDGGPRNEPAPQYHQQKQHYQKPYRKKSFFEELFD